jgi:hypothetical protein
LLCEATIPLGQAIANDQVRKVRQRIRKLVKEWKLQYMLKIMCKKADIELPERGGWHSLRRRVVTDVYDKTSAKEKPIINYFRWSNKQRHLSQLPTYVKSEVEETDREILSEHPILKMWNTIIPWLMKWHTEYSDNPKDIQLYNENISHDKKAGTSQWIYCVC